MDKVFFSIIIPTYNRSGFIVKAIESVLSQKFSLYEIIIVDDGSTDNTEEVVRPFLKETIRYFKIVNSERAAARNKGMNEAKGTYITFLDSDDIYYPDYLSNAYESINKYDSPVFFHQAYESYDALADKSLKKFSVKNDDVFSLVKGNHLSCLGIFLKRDDIASYRFNEDRNLAGSEDWELWLRIASRFGIKTDDRVSAALIIHDNRSVLSYDENKLLHRKNLALSYSFQDSNVISKFGKYRRVMEAYCDTYIALHLALSANNRKAIKYLFISFSYYPDVLFSKRALAIIKFVVLNVLGLRSKTA